MTSPLETLVRSLHTRKGRERRGLTLAEGIRLVEEVLAAGVSIKSVMISPALGHTPRGEALSQAIRARVSRVEEVDDRQLAGLASTEHPQGIIAVIQPATSGLEAIRVGGRSVVLVLDAVQDPGNVGTMVRTALALGAAGVVALPGTAELGNPKVLRAAMGASFRLPAVAASPEAFLSWTAATGQSVWVASGEGDPVQSATDRGAVALVLGNEGAGVGADLARAARRAVAIPLRGRAESLNVGVAAGILLWELLRDR
ncbi:MAG TPA: RNA methyltransferase [Gemmatimonadales bacterium]|nr:RNA methyltransferase [Gemmatimonadales bacterium]